MASHLEQVQLLQGLPPDQFISFTVKSSPSHYSPFQKKVILPSGSPLKRTIMRGIKESVGQVYDETRLDLVWDLPVERFPCKSFALEALARVALGHPIIEEDFRGKPLYASPPTNLVDFVRGRVKKLCSMLFTF